MIATIISSKMIDSNKGAVYHNTVSCEDGKELSLVSDKPLIVGTEINVTVVQVKTHTVFILRA